MIAIVLMELVMRNKLFVLLQNNSVNRNGDNCSRVHAVDNGGGGGDGGDRGYTGDVGNKQEWVIVSLVEWYYWRQRHWCTGDYRYLCIKPSWASQDFQLLQLHPLLPDVFVRRRKE